MTFNKSLDSIIPRHPLPFGLRGPGKFLDVSGRRRRLKCALKAHSYPRADHNNILPYNLQAKVRITAQGFSKRESAGPLLETALIQLYLPS